MGSDILDGFMRKPILVFLAIAGAMLAAAPPYAITNARIVTAPGKTIERGTIVLRNGLIEAVGANLAIPPDARVFDASGLTVYSGLIDAATHYGFAPIPVSPPVPIAPAPVPDVQAPDRYLRPVAAGVNAHWSAAERMVMPSEPDTRRAQGFTTVISIPREGHWRGTSALVNLGEAQMADNIVRARVAMHVDFRLPIGSRGRYPSSSMGVFAVLRQSLIAARQYREARVLYEAGGESGLERPRFDPVSEALLPVLDGQMSVVLPADTEDEIGMMLRFAQEWKLKPILIGGTEAWRVADRLKQADIPVLLRASLRVRLAGVSTGTFAAANTPVSYDAEMNPARLEKAGVRFAFASADQDRPLDIVSRVRVAIERGLSPNGALRALTAAPAEILGAARQLGTIEPGKIANLTLVDGDLFDPKKKGRATVIDGFFFHAPETPAKQPVVPPTQVATADAPRPQTPDDPTPSRLTPQAAPDSTSPRNQPPVPEPAPGDLVIRNATILTVTKGTIDGGSIWLKNGKIHEVGKAVSAPVSAQVIDGTGRFVMPGIVDSHSHSGTSGGINELGPSVTAQVRITDVLLPHHINLYRQLAGGVTTLNILHGSGNAIGGQNATLKLKWGSRIEDMMFPGAPRGLKLALGENPKRSNLGGGVRFPNTRMGVETVIRESFKAAREYAAAWTLYKEQIGRGEKRHAPEHNETLEVLADVLAGRVLVHAHCYRADEISMLLDLADEMGFKIRSLQHVLEGYKVTDKIVKHGVGASTFADFWGYKLEAWDGTPYNAALMVRAGVRTAINSDSDERSRRLHHEAAKAMKYGGLTENEALRTITTEPAWMLGVDKRVGALEPGMDGDLAVFNAHPFSPYARVEMTLVDGQVVFDREKDLKLRVPWKEDQEPEAYAEPLPSPAHAELLQ